MANINVSLLVQQSIRLSWQRKELWIPAAGIPLQSWVYLWLSGGLKQLGANHPEGPQSLAQWIAHFVSYLLAAYLLVIVTHEALTVLQDGTVSLRRSVARASSKLPTIVGCGALLWIGHAASDATTNAPRHLGWLVGAIGFAWGFSLYLIFPVLSRETENGTAAILRTWRLIRRCWRQRLWGLFQLSLLIGPPTIVFFMVVAFIAAFEFRGKSPDTPPTFLFGSAILFGLITTFVIAADQLFDCALYLAVADDQPTEVPPVPEPQAA
jgi:hypothetical protein